MLRSHVKALPEPDPRAPEYKTLKALITAVSILQGTLKRGMELDRAVTFRDLGDPDVIGAAGIRVTAVTESPNFSHSPKQGWQLNDTAASYIYHRLDVGSLDSFGTIQSKNVDAITYNGFKLEISDPSEFWPGLIVGKRLDARGPIATVEYADAAAVTSAYSAMGLTITDGDVVNIAGALNIRVSSAWQAMVTAAALVSKADLSSADFDDLNLGGLPVAAYTYGSNSNGVWIRFFDAAGADIFTVFAHNYGGGASSVTHTTPVLMSTPWTLVAMCDTVDDRRCHGTVTSSTSYTTEAHMPAGAASTAARFIIGVYIKV